MDLVGQSFISELPIYLLYLANFFPVVLGITWSLASEEQFYLLWPLLEKYFSKIIFFILFLAIIVNQIINFYRETLFTALDAKYFNDLSIMQSTFTPILLGVLLAHILHKKIATQWLLPLIDKKYSALLWLLLLLVIVELAPGDISGLPRLMIQITMVLLVGSTVIREDHYLNFALTFYPVARIGAISYSIYLFHIHGIIIANKILDMVDMREQLFVFSLSMLITVVMAELSFRLYEAPFLKLKSRFTIVHQKHT